MPECRYCGKHVPVDEHGRGPIPAIVPPTQGVFCSVECYARDRREERQQILRGIADA